VVPLLLAGSRHRSSSPLAVIAGGVVFYAVSAMAYQHLLKPEVNTSVPQAAVQYLAIPTAASAEPAASPPPPNAPAARAARPGPAPGSPAEQIAAEHMRFVSGVAKPGQDTTEKPAAAESKKVSARREPSGREPSGRSHRPQRQVAFPPFNLFRPFF